MSEEQSQGQLQYWSSPAGLLRRQALGRKMRLRYQNPEARQLQSDREKGRSNYWLIGTKHTEEWKQRQLTWVKGHYVNRGAISRAHIGKKQSPEAIRKISEALRGRKQSKELVERRIRAAFAALKIAPNKCETKLQSILRKYFPGQWAFVGDWKLVIGGKCPDFANVNGAKTLIELYGEYFHKGQNPQERIDHFRQFGYQTIVIWAKELKDEDLVVERVRSLELF